MSPYIFVSTWRIVTLPPQAFAEVAANCKVLVPSWQFLHEVSPVWSWYEFLGQTRHKGPIPSELNFPAGHGAVERMQQPSGLKSS